MKKINFLTITNPFPKSFPDVESVHNSLNNCTIQSKIQSEILHDLPTFKTISLLFVALAIPSLIRHFRKDVASHPWAYKAIWAIASLTNLLTLSLPNRLDQDIQEGVTRPIYTLFDPANWAFSIWSIIIPSEILLALTVALLTDSPQLIQQGFRKGSLFWLAAHVYQLLWGLSYRKEFKNVLALPAGMLAAAACYFYTCYQELSKIYQVLPVEAIIEKSKLALDSIPIAMHVMMLLGTALQLLNSRQQQIAAPTGIQASYSTLSGLTITTIGMLLSFVTANPVFTLVSMWILYAVDDQIAKDEGKLIVSKEISDSLIHSNKVFIRLSQVGVLITSWVAILNLYNGPGSWKAELFNSDD